MSNGRPTENELEISLSNLQLNINTAMLDYCKNHGGLPTAAFVDYKLFKRLSNSANQIIIKKPGAEKTEKETFQKFIFRDYTETNVYTYGEIYNEYKEKVSKLLREAKNIEMPLTLCRHNWFFRGFKKVTCYNIRAPTKELIQTL